MVFKFMLLIYSFKLNLSHQVKLLLPLKAPVVDFLESDVLKIFLR